MRSLFERISPIFISLLAFLVGIIWGRFGGLIFLLCGVFSFIFLWILVIRGYYNLLIFGCVFLLIGFWRYQSGVSKMDEFHIASYRDREIIVTGEILEKPKKELLHQDIVLGNLRVIPELLQFARKDIDNSGYTQQHFRESNEVGYINQKEGLKGRILLRTRNFPEYEYGQILEVNGIINKPASFADFDYSYYLSHQGIFGIVYFPKISVISDQGGSWFLQVISRGRNELISRIKRYFEEPEASLLSGIVLGVKNSLPTDFEQSLRRTGTTHIVVVSGANITFLMMTVMSFSSYWGRKRMAVVSLLTVLFYVFLVGFDPPVLRAFFMFFPVFIAQVYGREAKVITNLLLAAVVILAINPLLIHDLSFQLSFTATLGLILLMPIFQQLIRLPNMIKETVLVSLAAQMMTLPITVYNFQEFSLISLLANLFVLPIVPIITYGGFIFFFLSLTMRTIAIVFSFILYLPLTYFVWVINYLGSISFASISLEKIPLTFVMIYYLALGLFIIGANFLLKKHEGKLGKLS